MNLLTKKCWKIQKECYNIPHDIVFKTRWRGERSYDIYSRLLKDRVIVVFGEITDELSASIISQMLFLASKGDEDIYLYINSPGGSVSSGLAIYDVMNYLSWKCFWMFWIWFI